MRIIESFEDYTDPVDNVINEMLLPTLFGQNEPLPEELSRLFTLSPAEGGLGMPALKEEAPQQYAASLLITASHTEAIKTQSKTMYTTTEDTSTEYWNLILSTNPSPGPASPFAFDTVWTTALVMDKALKDGLALDNFTYTSRIHMRAFRTAIRELVFEGVSGTIRFDSKRERQGHVVIKQMRNASWVEVGQHFTYQDKLEFFGSSEEHLWPGNRVPIDQMIRIDDLLLNPVTLIAVIWLLAFVGALLSIVFLYFNIVYRENRSIKMSSPQLNNVIILGCLLCYISVILFGLDGRFLSLHSYGINCNARTAVLSIGFSLAFGAMFSKTWRVHKIFTAAKTLKKMAIKDIHLFGIVAALVVIDVIFLSLWFAYDPLQAHKLKFNLMETTNNDKIYVPVLYQCTCQYKTYFLATMYVYKGILLLFGLFLAWETRNVTIAALNDSKYIGMSVYNVVTLSCIGAIVTTALDNTIHYEAPYAISSLCLIICTTATLLLVFVPKVYNFVMGTDDQSFNTATMTNGVATTIGRNQSHAFRFDSDNGTKATRYSTKSVQTDHHEVTGSAVTETFMLDNTKDYDNVNINKGYEIDMDDIELKDSSLIPKTRYDQQVTDNGLVTLMLTDM
ncbi:gamma-aminobutyric acid type B receptor subunit 2-like [Actinia tenebrosa]|uniref:Gamma-aminobutyric acid type B receptor subunit 2-like n=1 Tax=Actinia tenebrosa TaxID=6105 RepID=A0A6P8H6W5_ACTTE|nr:gamma-aminobutyric acid type B receptor subunit 2-like [Actinia tenebrosa]